MSEAKMDSILEYSVYLQTNLQRPPPSDSGGLNELDTYLDALPLPYHECSQSQRTAIKSAAVTLWNSCVQRIVETNDNAIVRRDTTGIQAYSFLLLESIIKPVRKTVDSTENRPASVSIMQLKHFRLGVDTARACLSEVLIELAVRIMELLVGRYEIFSMSSKVDQEQVILVRSSIIEFVCLRIVANWKRDRLDLSVHQQNSLVDTVKTWGVELLPACSLQAWLDLLYEIGVDQMIQARSAIALIWLRFARELLQNLQGIADVLDCEDIQLNIIHTYTRCLFSLEDTKAGEEAAHLLRAMKIDYKDKLCVTLLSLEISCKSQNSPADEIASDLAQIIRSVHLIESNHKLVTFYILQLHKRNSHHASQCLCDYLLYRLAPHGNHEWFSSAIVLLISITASSNRTAESHSVQSLSTNLISIGAAFRCNIPTEAARASLMYIWRKISSSESAPMHDVMLWCEIGLHTMFENAGDEYVGRIQRRLMHHYLSVNDHNSAQAVLGQMNPSVRHHLLSRFLTFQIHIRSHNEQGAQDSFSQIMSAPEMNSDVWIACIGEATKHAGDLQSVRLLQRLFDKCANNYPSDIDLPVLLRCLARLLIKLADNSGVNEDEVVTRLCAVFKAASTCDRPNGYNKSATLTLSSEDRHWLSLRAYEVATNHVRSWPTKVIIDLLQYSFELRHQSIDIPSSKPDIRQDPSDLMILFIQALLYANEARRSQCYQSIDDLPRTSYESRYRPSNSQIQNVLYKKVFDRYLQISNAFHGQQQTNGIFDASTLYEQLCTLIPLAFEALLYMGVQSAAPSAQSTMIDELSLVQIVDNAARIRAAPKTFALLCDLILSATGTDTPPIGIDDTNTTIPPRPQLPLLCATRLLNKIITHVRNTELYSLEQASRWIRCIVQLIIDHHNKQADSTKPDRPPSGDNTTILNLLKAIINQALTLATSAARATTTTTTSNQYPEDELTYLATVLFNLSIDLYIADNVAQARDWAGLALALADVISDCSSQVSSQGRTASLSMLMRRRIADLPGLN